VPATFAPGERRPFLLVLHGLGGAGASFASGLGIDRLARDERFVYAAPDGALDAKGRRFWNASRACCDFDRRGTDHVGSLGALIARAKELPSVDPSRIYVLGFSNGAFMAHRLACSVPGIAAIVSVAGAGPTDGDPPCKPGQPVAVLEVHGDADKAVRFDGGHVLDMRDVPAHPSAERSIGAWAKLDGCGDSPKEEGRLDLTPALAGAETRELRYAGCKAPVELWRVEGGDHFAAADSGAVLALWSFLEKQRAPG
jgi:polyhydroxybutyrate depolymerase